MSKLMKYHETSQYKKGEFRKIMSKQEALIKKNFQMILSLQAFYYRVIGINCVDKKDNKCTKDYYNGGATVSVGLGNSDYSFNKQTLDDLLASNISLLSEHLALTKNGQDNSKGASKGAFETKTFPIEPTDKFTKYINNINDVLTSDALFTDDMKKRLFFKNRQLRWPTNKEMDKIMDVYNKKLKSKRVAIYLNNRFASRIHGLQRYLKNSGKAGEYVDLKDAYIPYSFFISLVAIYKKYGGDKDDEIQKDIVKIIKDAADKKKVQNPISLTPKLANKAAIETKYIKNSDFNTGISSNITIDEEHRYYIFGGNSNYKKYLYGYYLYAYFNICGKLQLGYSTLDI